VAGVAVALLGRPCSVNTRPNVMTQPLRFVKQQFSTYSQAAMFAVIASQAGEPYQNIGSSASSVDSWLEGHPHDPADYEHNQPASKKRRPRTGKPSAPEKRRKQLAEISVNSMSVPEPRQTRGRAGGGKRAERSQNQQADDPPSPDKTPKAPFLSLRPTRRGDAPSYDAQIDAGRTPRASANPLHSKPDLSQPRHEQQQSTSSRDSSSVSQSQSPSSASRAPSSSSRPKSPSKPETDLQLSDIRVVWFGFKRRGSEIPEKAHALLKNIKRIGKGFRVIPYAVKNRAMEHMIGEDGDMAEEDFMGIFGDPERAAHNEDLTADEVLGEVVKIRTAVIKCRDDDVAEPEWNSAVHYPLIKLALTGFWEGKGIWFHDISTARISDTSLLPGIASRAKKVQSKMVDYAMVIRPAEDLLERIIDYLRNTDGFSMNQTDARYMRFRPIGLSIETKRSGIEEDKSNTQLGTWVSAQFAKLSQLVCGDVDLPILPLIMIQGNRWEFMIAHKVNARKIEIYRDQSLGGTDSILGVYQLLAALRRLAQWMDEVLRPWFETHVL